MEEKQYTHAELLKICEDAFTPQSKWRDRDSAMAHLQLGECYALLKAGCDFETVYAKGNGECSTDEETIWLQFWVHDFSVFEHGIDSFDDKRGNKGSDYFFYLPTRKRLKERKGGDWY